MPKSRTAARCYRAYLAKAEGAGSRGGNVIGHTRSGKTIYASSSKHYHQTVDFPSEDRRHLKDKVGRSFSHYSNNDHHDAVAAHRKAIARVADSTRNYASGSGIGARAKIAQHHHAVNHHLEALHPTD